MRRSGFRLAVTILAICSCRQAKLVPEDGAILLHVQRPVLAPTPDELWVWVYDDRGALWDGARVPAEGPLPIQSAQGQELGTILIHPVSSQGALRIHIAGLSRGFQVLDGVALVPADTSDRELTILLDSVLLPDADRDGVPDSIDDCTTVPDRGQTGCGGPGQPDSGPDGRREADAGVLSDAAPVLDLPGGKADGPPSQGGDVESGGDARATSDVGVVPNTDVISGPDGNPDRPEELADASPSPDVPADLGGTVIDASPEDRPKAASCVSGVQCASGYCVDGVCCDDGCAGPCRSCNQPATMGSCQAYATGTDPERECLEGATCNGSGACGPPPPRANGVACTEAGQCLSGACKDGVCCESACTGECQTCITGQCQTVRHGEDAPECVSPRSCDSKGKCL